jgi:acylphosphatase
VSKVQLHILGRVQGVCYRQSAQQIAKSLNLFGWVRNLPDGSVQAEAQGMTCDLEAFVNWCKQGPARAQVEDVKVVWLTCKSEESVQGSGRPTFEIIG